MTRQCDAIACDAEVKSGKFMCTRHWRMVPVGPQRTINERYRANPRDFAFLSDVLYLEACIAAIHLVAEQEGKPLADSTYHRLMRVAQRRAAESNT